MFRFWVRFLEEAFQAAKGIATPDGGITDDRDWESAFGMLPILKDQHNPYGGAHFAFDWLNTWWTEVGTTMERIGPVMSP